MRIRPLLLLAALMLGGCQSVFGPNLDKPLMPRHLAWEHKPAGCQGEDCPLVNIDYIEFGEPTLDALVQRHLLGLARAEPGAPIPASLTSYERDFLAKAQPRWSSYLQAKVREQHDGLVIIEFSSYLANGGAHGLAGRDFVTWDRHLNREITLADVLVPGQEGAFWQLAQLSREAWMISNGVDNAEFRQQWPFLKTDNVSLDFGALTLKYGTGSIAPYAMGHPELKIPYPKLNGILKPEYFPGRGKSRQP
ncbi:lipoprotein [Pseudomonas oryzihabitans]|nr:lipoprotein [Pseudomonas psychrotolerans]